MAFLDNSGDIILDAVLTDTGRARLAKGDGSFKIVKFALADDEIDYSQYQNSNYPGGANPSGSAYYDLEILMTPILEAFTNNTSSMKSKLISIPRNNLLYLPVMKINDSVNTSRLNSDSGLGSINAYICAVDEDTEDSLGTVNNQERSGILFGENTTDQVSANRIRIDQGLDTTEISSNFAIDADLKETQYIVEIDNRFGSLISWNGQTAAAVSYIDDDNVASYYLSLGTDLLFVNNNEVTANNNNGNSQNSNSQVIAGPRGTILEFKIRSSLELNTSNYLFEKLGSSSTLTTTSQTVEYYFIDSIVRVTGATTGYRIDIPVRFVKAFNITNNL
jgi:hypothetical protein